MHLNASLYSVAVSKHIFSLFNLNHICLSFSETTQLPRRDTASQCVCARVNLQRNSGQRGITHSPPPHNYTGMQTVPPGIRPSHSAKGQSAL